MKTSRRNFLKVSSLAGTGLALQGVWMSPILAQDEPSTFSPNFLLSIDLDGIVHFKYTRHEMGQGSFTGLSMIFADELGADWNRFRATQADFDLKYGDKIYGNTGGSGTIRGMWQPLREMAAKARLMLIQAAAHDWKVDPQTCKAENGVVRHPASNRTLDFGDLVEKAAQLPIPQEASLKKLSEFQLIGQPLKNLNIDKINQGSLDYGIDIKRPGLLYAAILRAPVFGAKVKSFDDSEIKKMPGIQEVIEISDRKSPLLKKYSPHLIEGVAILGDSTWQVFEARKKLKVVWEEGANRKENQQSLEKEMAASWDKKARIDYSAGNPQAGFQKATRNFTATYTNPFQAHALMEPLNCTAHVKGNTCEIWSSMQHPRQTLDRVAPSVDIPRENFTIHNLPCGGSFGRRFYEDYVTEAVYLSKVLGKPVKVTWSREDEIRHDGYHELQHMRHRVGLDEENNILAWESREVFSEPIEEVYVFPLNPYYDQHYLRQSTGVARRLPTMAWRSVQAHQSAMGIECFIDELAQEIKQDPLELRLSLLKNYAPAQDFHTESSKDISNYLNEMTRPKAIRVLEKVKSLGLWPKQVSGGIYRGLAGFPFGPTYCAEVAEVVLEQGKVRIKKIHCVVDCGLVINPQLAKGQIEGGVIWGLSALKYNQITLEQGRVQQSNFHDYPILRMDEVPEIEVHFLASEESPSGTGEPGVPPLAPAVLNAIFAATGKRLRRIPILAENILA
ncbi:MAG: molybdopterin cofactor-binding domain-containing protein [Bacteroidota bacterium]